MALNMRYRTGRVAALLAVAVLIGAGCGDDDDDDASTSATTAASGDETTTTAGDVAAGGDNTELCDLARTMFEQEDFPTAEQIRQYRELAPDELQDAIDVAGAAITDNEGNTSAAIAAVADDDVEAAIGELNTFENENCGLDHDASELGVGPNEPEDGATEVDVTASEYTFDIPDGVAAGRTSFVLSNAGQEAHFMSLTRILQGTLEEALAFQGDPEEAGLVEGIADSNLAAPGGDDVEVVTADLEPGDYAMLCFVPGPDGTPHAFLGMAVPFTVS
jgi:hypothetical protein